MSCKISGLCCPTFFGTDLGQNWDKSGQGLPSLLIFWDTWDRLSQKYHGTKTPCLTPSETLSPCLNLFGTSFNACPEKLVSQVLLGQGCLCLLRVRASNLVPKKLGQGLSGLLHNAGGLGVVDRRRNGRHVESFLDHKAGHLLGQGVQLFLRGLLLHGLFNSDRSLAVPH